MVSAKFTGGGKRPLYEVTCARCDAPREMPDPTPGRSRMPAVNADGSTTLDADGPCGCGSERVRVALNF